MSAPLNAPDEALESAPLPLVRLSIDVLRAKEYLEAIVASTSDAICTTDMDGRIKFFSPGAERMLEMRAGEAVGRPAFRFYEKGRPEAEAIMKRLRKNGALEGHEMALKAQGGRLVHVSMSASLLRDRAGALIGTLGISKDISARIELERRLRELSITDNLTGLYNQRNFHEKLSQEAMRARRQGYPLSLIVADLDGFKQVNDLWGHQEGDRILKAFSAAITQSIRREVDTAFRCGGDEFFILLPGLDEAQSSQIAGRISLSCRPLAARRGVGFSWGVACLGKSGSLAALVRRADRRMFRMKSLRRERSPRPVESLMPVSPFPRRPFCIIAPVKPWPRFSSSMTISR